MRLYSLAIFPLLIIIIGLLSLGFIVYNNNRSQQALKAKANYQPNISINDYSKDYATMLKYYHQYDGVDEINGQLVRSYAAKTSNIQIFGGGVALAEFNDNNSSHIFAGHLGQFWAPPFYGASRDETNNSIPYCFCLGAFFTYQGYSQVVYEKPSDPETEATYYPSKLVATKSYPGGTGTTDVRGVKVALPVKRGFGLQFTITNNRDISQPGFQMGFIGYLPTFDLLDSWNPKTESGWNWKPSTQSRNPTNLTYDESNHILLYQSRNNQGKNAYLAVVFNRDPSYWATGANISSISQALSNRNATLPNSQIENNRQSQAFGVQFNIPLQPHEQATINTVIGIGYSPEEAISIAQSYRYKNLENEADNFWNQRLTNLMQNLPTFKSGDDTLNQIYKNSLMSYLINRWDSINSLGEVAGYASSPSLYPWFTGTSLILSMADPPFWKNQLIKLLSLDLYSCNAYDNVSQLHKCDLPNIYYPTGFSYSYNLVSMINAVYQYTVSTSDWQFLKQKVGNQTVIQKLESLLNYEDSRENPSFGNLVDYGHDRNLFELDRHCDLGGLYNGIVPSPNMERAISHRQLARLWQRAPLSPGDNRDGSIIIHQVKSQQIIDNVNQNLWNPNTNFFNNISLYSASIDNASSVKPKPATTNTAFHFVAPLFLLQYDNLLTPTQTQALLKQLNTNFTGTYGFLAVGRDSPQYSSSIVCQADWHGQGLYTGAVGVLLTSLFKNNQATNAYNILSPASFGSGYAYLKNMPYFSQAMPGDFNFQSGSEMSLGNIEGISFAQSFIEGLFGYQPNQDQTHFAPHVPARLLNSGPVSLENINSQGHTFFIKVNSQDNQEIVMINIPKNIQPGNHTRFSYDMQGTLRVTSSHMVNNTRMQIRLENLNSKEEINSFTLDTDDFGNVSFTVKLTGPTLINITPAD